MDFLYPTYFTCFQTYLDAVRVVGRLGQNILYDPFGQLAAALILFQYYGHQQAGYNILSFGSGEAGHKA